MPPPKEKPTEDTIWICTKCKVPKPIKEFRKSKSYSSGYVPQCNPCIRKYVNIYQNTEAGKLKLKKAGLKYSYGITLDEYNKMLEEQGNVCAICKKFPQEKHAKYGTIKSLSVDHNHATDKVRGILCGPCNRAIGYLKSVATTLSAAAYLQERGEY